MAIGSRESPRHCLDDRFIWPDSDRISGLEIFFSLILNGPLTSFDISSLSHRRPVPLSVSPGFISAFLPPFD